MAENDQSELPTTLLRNLDMFACPACDASLRVSANGKAVECIKCEKPFNVEDGIPLMFCPNEWGPKKDVTGIVETFYDETPFPNYDDVDSGTALQQKAESGFFARLLNEQIPLGYRILEVGCGTGQLSNYFALKGGRTHFASDISLNALKLGQEFKIKNNIDDVLFLKMNLFRPVFRQETFDVVICSGVLHHTSDPLLGFQAISRLVKEDGYIVIGLYNRYGRIPTDIRRLIFRVLGRRFTFLDPRLRDASISKAKKETWFQDQYKHPHESKHTIGQVLKWFDQMGFAFVNGVPKATAKDEFALDEALFARNPEGTWLDHLLVQAGMLVGGGEEGGFFILIGQKRSGDDGHQGPKRDLVSEDATAS